MQSFADRQIGIPPAKPWAVTVLEWPEEAEEAEALAAAGVLRLLLVAPGVAPPVDWDLTSDWLRRPAEPRDVLARIETLQRRSDGGRPLRLDEDGLVWRGLDWVPLGPLEVRLMAVFLENMHRVVKRTELVAAGWPGSARGVRTLDTTIQRLRARVSRLGLEIVNVRRRGFVLIVAPDS
jgi:hypothetical protein